MRQEYICGKCGVESHVLYEEGADLWSVAQKISDDHRKWSSGCEGDLRLVLAPDAAERVRL